MSNLVVYPTWSNRQNILINLFVYWACKEDTILKTAPKNVSEHNFNLKHFWEVLQQNHLSGDGNATPRYLPLKGNCICEYEIANATTPMTYSECILRKKCMHFIYKLYISQSSKTKRAKTYHHLSRKYGYHPSPRIGFSHFFYITLSGFLIRRCIIFVSSLYRMIKLWCDLIMLFYVCWNSDGVTVVGAFYIKNSRFLASVMW